MTAMKKKTTLYVVAVEGIQRNKRDELTGRPAYGTFEDITQARQYQQALVEGGKRVRLLKTALETMEEL